MGSMGRVNTTSYLTSLEKDVALNFAKPPEKKEDLDKQTEES